MPSSVSGLGNLGLAIVVVAIILAFGALIVSNVQTDVELETSNTSTAYNATVEGLSAIEDISGWLGLIVIVTIGAFIIYILRRSFGGM